MILRSQCEATPDLALSPPTPHSLEQATLPALRPAFVELATGRPKHANGFQRNADGHQNPDILGDVGAQHRGYLKIDVHPVPTYAYRYSSTLWSQSEGKSPQHVRSPA